MTDAQNQRVWESRIEAEARSYYFADIASRESTLKRIFTGVSFVFSSAAIVTMLSLLPRWPSVGISVIVALVNGYQIAVGQDAKIKTASKLYVEWSRLEQDYDRLWNNIHEADAETLLHQYLARERDLSETGATEIDHNEKRWIKWLDIARAKADTSDYDREANTL